MTRNKFSRRKHMATRSWRLLTDEQKSKNSDGPIEKQGLSNYK